MHLLIFKIHFRVILNEQLEKIANMTLSHIKINNEHQDGLENNKSVVKDMETDRFKLMYEKMQHQTTKKDTIDDDEMENSNDFKTTHKNLIVLEQTDNYNHSKAIEIKIFNSEQQINSNKDKFLDNYCEIQNTNDEEEMSPNKPNQQEKLEAFIEKIKDMKNKEASKKSIEFERNSGKSRSSFKNRFMAQKNIIDIQKAKLDEQNKMIEELKLGIMREDILKSIEHTKFNIREIFANCSEKIKCKVPIACDQENKFNVSIQKAPKIVQRMEDRAVERARNREVILERKRLVEEMRRKMLEEAIENKRVLEEEERKRTLEIMKEKRKKELQLEKIRHEKRKIYEEKLHKAIDFHEFLLKQQCLRKLYNNVIFSREKYLIAVEHYRKKVLGESMNMWINFVDGLYVVKYEMADAHFSYKIFRYCIEMWKQVINICIFFSQRV